VVNDFVKPLRGKNEMGEGSDVFLARLLTVLFGGFAIGVAFFASSIEDMMKTTQGFLGLFSGPILALFLLGLLTRRAHFRAWVVGMVASVMTVMWIQYNTDTHFVYYFPISTLGTFTIGYVMSLFLKPVSSSATTETDPSNV
jgi:Na+/proline symporter